MLNLPVNSGKGEIQLIVGPMFAGKSTELIRRVRRFKQTKKSVIVVKHSSDTRYSDDGAVSTHDMGTYPATSANKLMPLLDTLQKHDIIAIDEGQFFPDIVEVAEILANDGKVVIVSGLDGNFMRKPFSSIAELQSLADSVEKLTSVCCKCHSIAPFSARISDETDEVVVGGADKYVAVCRECWCSFEKEKHARKAVCV